MIEYGDVPDRVLTTIACETCGEWIAKTDMPTTIKVYCNQCFDPENEACGIVVVNNKKAD